MTKFRRGTLVLPFLAAIAAALGAADQNLDRRAARGGPDAAARQLAQTTDKLRRVSARLGAGISTDLDPSGKLRALARRQPPLSAPDGRDAEVVARAFVSAHRELFDLDDRLLDTLELTARDRSGPNSLLRYRQQWEGIPVFQSDLRAHVSPAGEVMELQFHLELGAPEGRADPLISASEAARRGVEGLEPELRDAAVAVTESSQRHTVLRFGPRADEVRAELVYFPDDGLVRLAWRLDALSSDGETYYECVVDARDGELLYRNSITSHDTIGTVFEGASPQPSATYGTVPPVPNPPVLVSRTKVSFQGDSDASPQGWVGAGNETIGNNVTAREDKAGDNEGTLGATAKATMQGSDRLFDFNLQLGAGAPSPVNFTEAAVTSLFYWSNVAHDYFYNLGFTEAAGNFQEDNFGKGGRSADALRADAQDGSGVNNANFSTPTDGSRPRMQMFLWNSAGQVIDGDFDAEVIFHEYTHGIFGRLVTFSSSALQTGAMNEGNSDFFALNYFVPESAPRDGAFTAGSYATQNFSSGVRSRPYSTDPNTNDLTYGDLGRVISRPEVHADGEIWVEAMWEVRSQLVKKYGYKEGRRRVALLMVDALKRSAITPSYVDMRDALIAADNADFNGADQPEIWEAFARRGLGYMAVSGDGASLNILPSTEVPSSAARIRFFERTYYAGEALRIYVGDDNNRDLTTTLRLETTSGDRETMTVSRAGVLYRATIMPIAGTAVPDDGKLQVAAGDTVRAFYRDRDDGTGVNREIVAEVKVRAAYTTELRTGGILAQDETALNLRGTNTTATVRLPFGFPFYGRLVTSVIVSTNGLITIGATNASSTNTDLVTFARFSTIAPLWDALRTNGNAQSGEDIYVARTADTIRFRWVAETVAGSPVNFAVTLAENGDIDFSYGSGNTSVSPTVGLSRGTETLTQIVSSYSSSVNISLENAATVHWTFPGLDRTTTLFPFFRGNAAEFTGYAAANLGSTPVDVLFTARADTGEKLISTTNPNSLELRAGSQIAQVGDQIIRPDTAGGNREGWVEAQSPSNAVSGFYLYGDNAQSYLDGTVASSRTARDLVFTRLQGSTTSVYLVNPTVNSAAAKFQWIDSAGNVVATVSRTIAARGRLAASPSVLFPQITASVLTGYLRVTSDVGLAGVEVLAGTGSVTMIPAQEPSTVTTLYSAQFASGVTGGIRYFTDLSLVNTSSVSRSISILLVGNDGVAVTGPGITNPMTRTLAAGAQLRARGETLFGLPDAATTGTFHEGSLVMKADGAGVIGDVTFGDAAGERFAASLPLDGVPLADLVFAQVAEGRAGGTRSYFTGAAFYNPNTTTVTLTVSVFSKRGIPVGTATLTLDPGARVARTLAQLVPGLTQLGGYVRVTSKGGAVSSFAVYGDSALEFLAAVPPQRGS